MSKTPVILIFDVGKTNKKLLLFDKQYKSVYEESVQLAEIKDEDGFPCEDVYALTQWITSSFRRLLSKDHFDIKAVNFSAYGASFVLLDNELNVSLPLYNYLKPYSPQLQKQFYQTYGGESLVAKQTASPVLGNLNSGMQLYRLKYEKPEAFAHIKYALHLPQYLSFVLTGEVSSDITSIGCHTNLWNFKNNKYHQWVEEENINSILAPVAAVSSIGGYANESIPVGIGLHDSSAALIPYLSTSNEPFILISTGTWCISLNPFNHSMLTEHELDQDCLCYLSYESKPVKASRLFAGYEHEQQIKKLSEYFNKPAVYYTTVKRDTELLRSIKHNSIKSNDAVTSKPTQSAFEKRNLENFKNYEEAYHQLMADIMSQQILSINLVLNGTTLKRIFVDGGFSKNPIYMYLLAEAFPGLEVYSASIAQASALGAALVFHQHWNNRELPSEIIDMQLYSVSHPH